MLVVVGMLVLALLIQADSPIRVDAFWATRPLHSSAVVAAKLLIAGLILLGIGVVGQVIALLSHDIALRELPALLASSSLQYAAGFVENGSSVRALGPLAGTIGVLLVVAYQYRTRNLRRGVRTEARTSTYAFVLTAHRVATATLWWVPAPASNRSKTHP